MSDPLANRLAAAAEFCADRSELAHLTPLLEAAMLRINNDAAEIARLNRVLDRQVDG